MKKQPTNGELAIMLSNISGKIEEMHNKQDYTNGRVMNNTEYRISTKATIDTFKWLFGFLGVGNIVLLASTLMNL